jgi:hypothetical protein
MERLDRMGMETVQRIPSSGSSCFIRGPSGFREKRGVAVSIRDKEIIEERFGPLWSGRQELSLGGRTRTISEVKRAFDLVADDVVAIDLVELPDGKGAFRYYDGEDRRVAVFVFDAGGEILEEHRAHIGEWLGDLYHDSGALAYDAEAMIHILQKKLAEGPSG